ncbi:MAG: glycosyltransferase family 39 protein [Bacteroidia bacterium]|nr:glycosyltransferase family 39 protein [Bacteroidia bacterium]
MRQLSVTTYFNVLVIALFVIIRAPLLFADGMFMDGTMYAAISRNLAQGIGTIWELQFSTTYLTQFHEHPPLMFWLQGVWFYILGDSIYVERMYSFVLFLINVYLIQRLWILLTNDKTTSFIPVLLYVVVPVVTWSYSSNMIECTMTLFVLLSANFMFKFINNSTNYWLVMLAGFLLYLAFMTKGFVALFVWGIPFFVWMVRQQKSMLLTAKHIALYVFFTVAPLLLMFVFVPNSYTCIVNYINTQVVKSLQSAVTVDSRFFIVGKLIQGILIPIVICAIIIVIAYKKNILQNLTIENKQLFWLCLYIGLGGVLPIMVSQKQSGYYIVATYPFFVITLGITVQPYVHLFIQRISNNMLYKKRLNVMLVSITAIAIIATLMQYKRIGRDKEQLTMVHQVCAIVPANNTITIDDSMYWDWALHAYLQRYGKLSLIENKVALTTYYLSETLQTIPNYSVVLRSSNYILFKQIRTP